MTAPVPGLRCLPLEHLAAMTPRQRDEYASSLYRRGRDAGGSGSPGELERMRETAQEAAATVRRYKSRIGLLTRDLGVARDELVVRDQRITELEAEVTRHRSLADPCPYPTLPAEVIARREFLMGMRPPPSQAVAVAVPSTPQQQAARRGQLLEELTT